jgi:hypothetical protein
MKSKAIDASNYEKCIIKFYFGAQENYPQYFNVFLKYRRNETSPWIDITPWTNPIGYVCEYYETEITYDPEGCGEALQIKWEYLGYYYYYFDTFCIDDVKILGIPINSPPYAPDISVPEKVKRGKLFNVTVVTTDPDSDDVYYRHKSINCTSSWFGPFPSGENYTFKLSIIGSPGIYPIGVQAKDINEAESEWSYADINLPRTRTLSYHWLFERFPLLERLLNFII